MIKVLSFFTMCILSACGPSTVLVDHDNQTDECVFSGGTPARQEFTCGEAQESVSLIGCPEGATGEAGDCTCTQNLSLEFDIELGFFCVRT